MDSYGKCPLCCRIPVDSKASPPVLPRLDAMLVFAANSLFVDEFARNVTSLASMLAGLDADAGSKESGF